MVDKAHQQRRKFLGEVFNSFSFLTFPTWQDIYKAEKEKTNYEDRQLCKNFRDVTKLAKC